jgi:methionyl-tRNA synthetase
MDQAWLDIADEHSAALSYLPFAFDQSVKAPAAPIAKKLKGRVAGKAKVEVDEDAIKKEESEYIDYFGGPLAGENAKKPKKGAEKFYLTTAINYTNGLPHMGHAYEGLTSDVICRYHRGYGRDVFFMTGTDEHGQKIAESAEKEGLTPIQLCDKYVTNFKALNKRMCISNNFYVRTTLPKHEKFAQWMWKRAYDAGDIYLDTYEGWYNVKEEAFVPEKEAELAEFKDAAGNPLKKMKEQSLFFRMSKYQDRLLKHIADNPSFIEPEARRKEIVGRLQEPLRDLSCSRTTFEWGVPIPEFNEKYEKKHVMYVWFDALSNYLSGIDYETGKGNAEYWNGLNGEGGRATHVIGKDITWFHCVIWPTMLMSTGIPLYTQCYAHGFVQDKEGKKMSKSIGNVIDPNDMLDRFPLDTFRYYTVSQTPYGSDLPFSAEALQLLHNSELADTLGNLVHRAVRYALYCISLSAFFLAPRFLLAPPSCFLLAPPRLALTSFLPTASARSTPRAPTVV